MSSPQITWDAEPQQIKWDDEATPQAKISQQIAQNPPGVPRPQVNMQMSPLGKGYQGPGAHDIPGSFEGHPENIGEWPVAGPGEIGGGVKDVAQGNVARGLHRTISGVGNTLMPFTPFIGTAAPLTTARALAGGYIGGKLGEGAADVAGANPDQKALAGDVGNIVGGGIAAEPGPVIRGTGRVMANHPHVISGGIGAAAGESLGHPIWGTVLGERFLRPKVQAIGERLGRFGIEPPAPANPFRDIPDPEADVFRETQPVTPQTAQPVGASIARPSEIPAPIRMGPGQIPPDIIAPPNPRILAGNQGIRTTPIGLLPASVEGGIDRSAMMQREAPAPVIARSPAPAIGRPDILDDDAMREAMNADLESHGAQARREVNQERRARNDVSVPKWKMAAEAKARQLMDEAQKKAEDRAINRELGKGIPKQAKPKIAKPSGGDEDLTPILKKSLAAVKKKKV